MAQLGFLGGGLRCFSINHSTAIIGPCDLSHPTTFPTSHYLPVVPGKFEQIVELSADMSCHVACSPLSSYIIGLFAHSRM